MTISGKPLSGPIVSGRPVRWPGPRPVPPGSAIPPTTPPPDPGPITPPGPRGEPPPKVDPPDTVFPGGQPPTPDPGPTGIASDWSDACVLTQHYAGKYRVRAWVRGALVLDRTLGFAEMIQQTYINECVHAHLRFAPNTDVEPWPSKPSTAAQKSASKEKLMADGEITLAEVLAQIQVLILNSEQVNKRLSAIEEHLAGAETEQPPAPPVDDDTEFWAQFTAAVDPDPATFEPEQFVAYERGRVLYQWRANFTPLAKRVYRDVAAEMSLIRKMYDDPTCREAMMFQREGIDWETAVYAILSGSVDDLFDTGFAARPLNQIRALAGKSSADLFAANIAGDKQGGTPGIGG